MALRATAYLRAASTLLVVDVVVAELAYVLQSVYERSRAQVAELIRSLLALSAVRVVDVELLHRTVEIYEHERLGFADAYLVASAERSGVGAIASFGRSIDRVATIERIEPP
jgi:predicted nucleic acid-binding protein